MKNIRFFLSENFHFLVVKFSVYLNRHVFVMYRLLASGQLTINPENLSVLYREWVLAPKTVSYGIKSKLLMSTLTIGDLSAYFKFPCFCFLVPGSLCGLLFTGPLFLFSSSWFVICLLFLSSWSLISLLFPAINLLFPSSWSIILFTAYFYRFPVFRFLFRFLSTVS